MRNQIAFRDAVAPINTYTPSQHALLRMSQRNLSLADIKFILQYGQLHYRAGAVIVFLRDKDIPKNKRNSDDYIRLQGATVVLSRDEPQIVTVYRNRERGLKRIRCKPERSCKSHWIN